MPACVPSESSRRAGLLPHVPPPPLEIRSPRGGPPTLFRVCPPQKVGGGADFARGFLLRKSDDGGHAPGDVCPAKCEAPPESVAAGCELVPDPRGRSLPFTFTTSSKSPLVICVVETEGQGGGQGLRPRRGVPPSIVRARKEVGPFPGQVAPRASS